MSESSKETGLNIPNADIFVQFGESKDYQVSNLRITDIAPDPDQPRRFFDPDKLEDLANSIKESGVLQAIVVRQDPDNEDKYILVVGERRWRASKLAGKEKVPARIYEGDWKTVQIVENLQREDLKPLEEATSLKRLREERHLNDTEISKLVGKSRTTVNKIISITRLPVKILDELDAYPNITKTTLQELASTEGDERDSLWAALKSGRITRSETRAAKKGERAESELSPAEKAIRSYEATVKKIAKVPDLSELDVAALKKFQKQINQIIKEKTA